MSNEWKRNKAPDKGVLLEVSGLTPQGRPRGLRLLFDSHGDLDQVESGAVPIEVVIGCEIQCNGGCVPFVGLGIILFPPGTKLFPEVFSIEGCCP